MICFLNFSDVIMAMSKAEFKNETITLFDFAKSQISDNKISTQFENMVSNYFNKWENKYNDKIINIDEKLKKNNTDIDKIYNHLKSSVCYDEKILEPTQFNNKDDGKKYIKYYEDLIKSSNKNIRIYQYKIGELLSKLRAEQKKLILNLLKIKFVIILGHILIF